MPQARRALSLLACALTCSCGSVFTELDEPSVCKTISNVGVPGVPVSTVEGIVVPFSINLRKELGNTKGAKGLVEVKSVQLTARSGIADFAFIQTATVDVIVAGDGGGLVSVASYAQPATYTPSSELTIPGNGSNVFVYVESGLARVSMALTGTPPPTAWTFDADVCIHITVEN